MSTQGVGTFKVNSKFASGNLIFYEEAVGQTATGDVLTIGTGAVKVGGTAQDVDFQWYGTGSLSFILDAGASSLTLVGLIAKWNGDTAGYYAKFDPSGDTNGSWDFGIDDYGIDVGFYGQTASNSMTWDASADALVFVAAGITMGVASTMILPVKASGSTTTGDIWLDTTDDKLHFYDGSGEVVVTST